MAECCCSENDEVRLIYACSGAANTGFLADHVARNLAGADGAKMTCLAAMGARLSGFLESAKSASANIMIDGCSVSCGKKIFTDLGIGFDHYVITDYGVEKGKTKITESVIGEVTEKVRDALKARTEAADDR